jgi:hypothetical protein
MHHPGKLDRDSLEMIRCIKDQYPYFTTARLLLIRNLYQLEDEGYRPEIEITAAYITDRRVLYEIIHPLPASETEMQEAPGEEVSGTTNPTEEAPDIPETGEPLTAGPKSELRQNISNLLSLQMQELELDEGNEEELRMEVALDIEKTYGGQDEKAVKEKDLLSDDLLTIEPETEAPVQEPAQVTSIAAKETTDDSADLLCFTDWLSTLEKPEEDRKMADSGEEELPNEKILIDKFIESNPRLEPPKDNVPHHDISADSVKEHDGIFTDTLARIYIKQGYYSKAIFAYEKLILKYPEKSDYFAGQIKEIKKITNKQ